MIHTLLLYLNSNKEVIDLIINNNIEYSIPYLGSTLSIKKDKRVPKIVKRKYIIRHQLIGLLLINYGKNILKLKLKIISTLLK
jgi:hypothetical protein